MQSVKFYTLGCKVNQYETQAIRERLLACGFYEIYNGKKVDIYVINTCTVTHRADAESLQLIRRAKRENPKSKIIVTGCLTELDQDKINKTVKNCLIVKNKNKENILGFLTVFNRPTGQPANRLTKRGISYFSGHTRAFLKIQDGCDNFCSYCKVPLVRGRSRSRPLNEIVTEAQKLVKNGFKEIVLTGICLGSYSSYSHCEAPQAPKQSRLNLVDVISALEKIDGLARIRLSSIEAADLSDALINKITASKKLCPHLHIPIQSGDDEILKKMNRNYSRRIYLKLIRKIKQKIPGIAITTDVIVGFPGESEENFKNTVGLIKKIRPLKTHIFPYSPRQGTPAFNLDKKIDPAIIRERILRLRNITQKCSVMYRRKFLNKKRDVLFERRYKENPGFWEGYSNNYIRVLVKSSKGLENQIICLKLKKIVNDCLVGNLS